MASGRFMIACMRPLQKMWALLQQQTPGDQAHHGAELARGSHGFLAGLYRV